jgi:hypothetical protein
MGMVERMWTDSLLPIWKQFGVAQVIVLIAFLLIIILLVADLKLSAKCLHLSEQMTEELDTVRKRISTMSNVAIRAERSEKYRDVELQKKEKVERNSKYDRNPSIAQTNEMKQTAQITEDDEKNKEAARENEEIFRTFMDGILS